MAIVHLGAKRLQGTKVDRVVDSLGDYSIVAPESNLRLSEFRRSN